MSEPMEARGASGRAGTGTGPDPRDRFSDRVDAYVRHRPTYPREVVESLRSDGLLQPGATVADVGSGTGISSALFLAAGCTVYGVEPNAAMRAAAERTLARRHEIPAAPPRALGASGSTAFHSVAGSAEATTLPDASVDLAVAGQAFHWFD
ncbi:MAG: putative methyltransferase, partial [uncultured Phycisphaerae bacterium]